MTRTRHRLTLRVLAATLAVLTLLGGAPPARAANHREAPITALDHKADIADFFAFVSYDRSDRVTFLLDVDPLLEPSNGPNYFPFDPEVVYAVRVDNNHDGIEDVIIEVRFATQVRPLGPAPEDATVLSPEMLATFDRDAEVVFR